MRQKPENGGFSALLIGDESLLVGCGDMMLEAGHTIAGVITDNADIAAWAKGHGIATDRLRTDLKQRFEGRQIDWIFSIANLKILPDAILSLARRGAVNFHDGPLPAYAGVNAPVWALMAGETRYGITWHRIEPGIDTGVILEQRLFDIVPGETAHSLNAKCYAAGLESFALLLDKMAGGSPEGEPQDADLRSYFARDKRPEAAGRIDFLDSAETIARQVRALDHGPHWNPLYAPKIARDGRIVLVGTADVVAGDADLPGKVLDATATTLDVATGDGILRLGRLSDQAGRAVAPRDLVQPGDRLDLLPEDQARALTKTMAGHARGDAIWRPALQGLAPLVLPFAEPGAGSNIRRRALPLPMELTGPRRVAVIAAWAMRSAGVGHGDIAYQTRGGHQASKSAGAYLSGSIPIRVGASAGDSPTFGQTIEAIEPRLYNSFDHPGFALDIVARDPGITDFAVPQVGVTEAAEQMIPGTVLTIVLPFGGQGAVLYDADRIDGAMVDRLIDRLVHMADLALSRARDATPLDALSMMPRDEHDALLGDWNATDKGYDTTALLHRGFEFQARLKPDALALVYEGESLTYGALNERANRVAHVLRKMGVGAGKPVGLCLSRSMDLVVGALAILKAGGAYVPIDPAYPADRIAHYLTDSAATVVLTEYMLADSLPQTDAERLLIDRDPRIALTPKGNPDSGVTSDRTAYLIYTSGSTGTPKGVMVSHRNAANFMSGMDDRIGGVEGGTWLALTSLSFDISVLELFYTLARGMKVVIASDEARLLASTGPARSDRPIDFSLFYWGNDDGPGPQKYKLLLEGAKFADAHGFNAVWTPERHFHAFGGPYPNPSVTGAAVAAVTQNIGVRAGSCVAPLHHPARIAEEWAVIDNLTGGRAGMAIASGWQPDDFVLRPENTPPANKPAMFEAIETLRKLWRGEAVEFPRQDGSPLSVVTQPRPVSAELPVWVTTAGNPDTWKEAGTIGANVLTHLLGQSVDEVADKIKIYKTALRAAGHDPADHSVTLMLHSFVGADRDEVRDIAREPMKDYLRAAAGLIKQYAWAFPAFKRPKGVENPFQIDLDGLSDEEMDAILDFAFQRYFDDSGLFGTVEECLERVESLKAIGVDEIACLIDYGIAPDVVLEGLKPLAEVLRLANIAPDEPEQDYSVAAQIVRHGVTHMQCTPSVAQMVLANDEAKQAIAGLTHLLVGGEPLPAALARDLRAATDATILNMYGPTETTIWSTTQDLGDCTGRVLIGKPIVNTRAYVLDDTMQPVPMGVVGELFLAGDGVTKGYWKRPDLTADRFPADPFGTGQMYRTGDLARWDARGRLECLGRADTQVKLRGHRIELGEIEAALTDQPGVAGAAVVLRDTGKGAHLVAFITWREAAEQVDLREVLAARLPAAMVPSQVVTLDALPLTPNNKIDRNALAQTKAKATKPPGAPARETTPKERAEATAAAAGGPSNSQAIIAQVWRDILGVDDIGSDDSFFALGGHSLLAVQAHRELKAKLPDARLSITDIFAHPTLGGLARHIGGRTKAPAAPAPAADPVPVSVAPVSPAPAPAVATKAPTLSPDRSDAVSKRRAMRARRESNNSETTGR